MAVNAYPWQVRSIRCDAGLTPTQYRVVSADDGTTVLLGPFTAGIVNTGTLRYRAVLNPVALLPGDYEIQWDDGSNTWTVKEDLCVAYCYAR